MFKLVVLSALLAFAAAKPSNLYHGEHLAYSAIAAPAVAIPTAVSHQSRTDIISKPVLATTVVAAPVAHAAVAYHAPAVAYHAPSVAYHAPALAVPTAVSYQSRSDVVSSPVLATTYAHAPVVAADPWAYSGHLAYGHGYLH